ncbi:UNVERIFIED_ORG: glycosyl transferase family 28 [Bacillus sp. AZ43]
MTVLLACSGGGHLKELHELVPRLGIADRERLWVTFDSGLSRSLLAGENVVFARHAGPRDAKNILLNAMHGVRLFRRHPIELAISTGASPAVSYLVRTALAGVPTHYIESAARAHEPSLTGRLMSRVPRVHTYTQYKSWEDEQWHYGGSVFDAFERGPDSGPSSVGTVVVTLGTAESLNFRRLVEALVPLLEGREVLWQTGATDVSGLPITGRGAVPHRELTDAIATADLVIAHAGIGAAVTALEQGKVPLLIPRRVQYGEHIDDHQQEIAADLSTRGLAVAREVEDLDDAALHEAAAGSVGPRSRTPDFHLRQS